MGWFLDEEKKSAPSAPQQEHHGVFAALCIMFFGAILTLLGWILKPLLSWLFDFRDNSKDLALIKVCVIFALFGGIIFGLWQFQFFRDLTLSKSHTLNRNTTGTRILFPDSSYFVTEGNMRALDLDSGSSKKYITYSGYTRQHSERMNEDTRHSQGMNEDMCPLVPRNETAIFSSKVLPREAEGFINEVEYPVEQKLLDVPYFIFFKEYLKNPRYIFKNKSEREDVIVLYNKKGTWGEFERDWNNIFIFPGGYKPFEVTAKFYEHAIVCF